MQAFVLIGSEQKQKEHIASFCTQNHIAEVYRHEFSELKIADARTIIKLLSRKIHSEQYQIVSISNPTQEALHALLKTVEELPSCTYVFFLFQSKEAVLPTILSRCAVVFLENEVVISDPLLAQALAGFFLDEKNNNANMFAFCEKYGLEKNMIQDVIVETRRLLLQNIENTQVSKKLFSFLKTLTLDNSFIHSNNVNARLCLEHACMSVK